MGLELTPPRWSRPLPRLHHQALPSLHCGPVPYTGPGCPRASGHPLALDSCCLPGESVLVPCLGRVWQQRPHAVGAPSPATPGPWGDGSEVLNKGGRGGGGVGGKQATGLRARAPLPARAVHASSAGQGRHPGSASAALTPTAMTICPWRVPAGHRPSGRQCAGSTPPWDATPRASRGTLA